MKTTLKTTFLILVILAVLVALAAGGYVLFKDTVPPQVTLTPDSGPVAGKTEFSLTANDISGLRNVTLTLVQGDKQKQLLSRNTSGTETFTESFTLPKKSVKDGPFVLVYTATDSSLADFGKGNTVQAEASFVLDSKPPKVRLESFVHNFNKGGTGLVLYTTSDDAVQTGVEVGEYFFPGYEQKDGIFACLFPFPFNVDIKDFKPILVAEDAAGNIRNRPVPFYANDRKFKQDTINIPDSFLNRKMPEFEDAFPDAETPLEVFLQVNNVMRSQNRASLREIGLETSPVPLWSGAFGRMKGARKAGFADYRSYNYNGKVVDHQTHLGVDLASIENAPIKSANNGTIVFADEMGIYGNCVIVDHGLGLQTLYAHLSEISVDKGDEVRKGDLLGRSGATGMAGGDHLHFGVIVSGVPVNPIEWWDPSWLKNNISGKLNVK